VSCSIPTSQQFAVSSNIQPLQFVGDVQAKAHDIEQRIEAVIAPTSKTWMATFGWSLLFPFADSADYKDFEHNTHCILKAEKELKATNEQQEILKQIQDKLNVVNAATCFDILENSEKIFNEIKLQATIFKALKIVLLITPMISVIGLIFSSQLLISGSALITLGVVVYLITADTLEKIAFNNKIKTLNIKESADFLLQL
jgi:hypothetical protein